MDDQRTDRAGSVILWAARILAATMLVFGVMGAVAALDIGDSPKGHLPVKWPGFISSAIMAIVGIAMLAFIEPRMRRKN